MNKLLKDPFNIITRHRDNFIKIVPLDKDNLDLVFVVNVGARWLLLSEPSLVQRNGKKEKQ